MIQLAHGERYYQLHSGFIQRIIPISSLEIDWFLQYKGWLRSNFMLLIVAYLPLALLLEPYLLQVRKDEHKIREDDERKPNPILDPLFKKMGQHMFYIAVAFLFLLPISTLHNIQEYSLSIYPLVNREIGGGKATQAQLVAELPEKTKTPTLGEILPLNADSITKTVPVCLIEQTDKNYYVLLGADGKQLPKNCILPNPDSDEAKKFRAIQVDKNLVKGIVYIKN